MRYTPNKVLILYLTPWIIWHAQPYCHLIILWALPFKTLVNFIEDLPTRLTKSITNLLYPLNDLLQHLCSSHCYCITFGTPCDISWLIICLSDTCLVLLYKICLGTQVRCSRKTSWYRRHIICWYTNPTFVLLVACIGYQSVACYQKE